MGSYHINAKGEPGLCRSTQGKCPFGDGRPHYPSAELARKGYEADAEKLEDSGQLWPPLGLPKRLHGIASAADLIRHHNDQEFGGGEGVCLGASAFISHKLLAQGAPHKLVRGEYLTEAGEAKAHWWIEASGWIIDPSRGQFEESQYKSGVVRANRSCYRKLSEFEPGHSSPELVDAELKRCFAFPEDAEAYHNELEGIYQEAEDFKF